MPLGTQESNEILEREVTSCSGKTLNRFSINKPASIQQVINWSRIISKLSPVVGNLLEYEALSSLNKLKEFQRLGEWIRQDPGFPDVFFKGNITPSLRRERFS